MESKSGSTSKGATPSQLAKMGIKQSDYISSASTKGGGGGGTTPAATKYVAPNKKEYTINNVGGKFTFNGGYGDKTFDTYDKAKAAIDAGNKVSIGGGNGLTPKVNTNQVVNTKSPATTDGYTFGANAPAGKEALSARNEGISNLLIERGTRDEQSVRDYLMGNEDFKNRGTPADQEKAITDIYSMTKIDPVGEGIVQDQASYMQKIQQEKEYAESQRSLQLQVNELSGELEQLASSQKIADAQTQLSNLKQNLAYLGTMGQPGQSSVQLDAISKQLSDADTTFSRIQKMEAAQAKITGIKNESQSLEFEKQMGDLQTQLNDNVNAAVQAALAGLSAAEIAGKIDTPIEVHELRGTLFQNLDKQIAGQIVGNAADRKLIIDRYNETIAYGEAFSKGKNVVNEAASRAKRTYIDMNGNEMVDVNGSPIAYVPEMKSVYDSETGTLVQYDDFGTIKTTKVGGGKGSDISFSDRMKLLEYVDGGGDINMAGQILGIDLGGLGVTNTTGEYAGPSYTPVTAAQGQAALTQVQAQGDGSIGGQCGSFVNDYLQGMGVGRLFTDPITEKQKIINSKEPTIGAVAIIDRNNNPNATLAQKKYGHVGVVIGEDKNGNVILKQSNKGGDEKVFTSTYRKDQIAGYFNPSKAPDANKPQGLDANLPELAEFLVDTQPRGQGISDDDAKAYTKAVKKYAARGDTQTVLQLYRTQVLKEKGNVDMVKGANDIIMAINSTNELMAQYKAEGGKMNIFNGTIQNVMNKLGTSGNPLLLQIKQNFGMMTADYIRRISGTAATDSEVRRLAGLLPDVTSTFDRDMLLSEGFKKKVIREAVSAVQVTMGKNKDMVYDVFPELTDGEVTELGQYSTKQLNTNPTNGVQGRWAK